MPSETQISEIKSLHFAGIKISYANIQTMVRQLKDKAGSKTGLLVSYINPHVFSLNRIYPEISRNLESCNFLCVDGIGISCFARILYRQNLPRVVANSLFDNFLSSLKTDLKTVVIGNSQDEADCAGNNIQLQNSHIELLKSMDGFRTNKEYETEFSLIDKPDLILIGCGNPRSDQLMQLAYEQFPEAIIWHVGGGTLRVYAGTKKSCPGVVSKLGMEWFHRFLLEPATRYRYSIGTLKYVFTVLKIYFLEPKHKLKKQLRIHEGLIN
jgi:N-acetylglucosaminyldiphosphoundecaprenol N-acetyl-beta-D-mannosaminyltransferase